jgi:hypothetical protein
LTSTTCHILIAPLKELQKSGYTLDTIRRHEIGHCNGWPGDHPGAPPSEPLIPNDSLRDLQDKVMPKPEPPPPPMKGVRILHITPNQQTPNANALIEYGRKRAQEMDWGR